MFKTITYIILLLTNVFIIFASSESNLMFVSENQVEYSSITKTVNVTVIGERDSDSNYTYRLQNLTLEKDKTSSGWKNILAICDTLAAIKSSEMYYMTFHQRDNFYFISTQAWSYSELNMEHPNLTFKGIYRHADKDFVIASDNNASLFIDNIFKADSDSTTIHIIFNKEDNCVNIANSFVTLMQTIVIDSSYYPVKFIKENRVIFNYDSSPSSDKIIIHLP